MLIFTNLHFNFNLPPFLSRSGGKICLDSFPRGGSPDSHREGRGYNYLRNCCFIHDYRYSLNLIM